MATGKRRPDFLLKAFDKTTEQKSVVGAGWSNPDGSISIQLELFVHLLRQPNVVLTLFPKDQQDRAATRS